jgi:tetratricopeptide (TPR) repeat protein
MKWSAVRETPDPIPETALEDSAHHAVSDDLPTVPSGETPDLVPGWLALAVLVLLLAVAAVGGYVIRGAIVGSSGQRPDEVAITNWRRAVSADPTNTENLLGLAYAYQEQGKYEDALIAYQKVLEADPGDTGALYNTGIIYLQLGRGDEAEEVLWDVLEVVPDHALAAKALGEYYIGKQHYKSALAALEPVIELRPHFADLQYLAGYACEQLDLPGQAAAYYRGALTYSPDLTEATEGLKRTGGGE